MIKNSPFRLRQPATQRRRTTKLLLVGKGSHIRKPRSKLLYTKLGSDTLQRKKQGLPLAGSEVFKGDEVREGGLDLEGRGDVDAAVFLGGAVADERGGHGADVAVAVDVAEGVGHQAEEVADGLMDDGGMDLDEGRDVEVLAVLGHGGVWAQHGEGVEQGTVQQGLGDEEPVPVEEARP